MNLEQHLDMDTTKIRRDLGYRETLWDRDYWPKEVDTAQFDYAAEEAILNDR